MSRFLKDIEFGFTKECEVLPIIKKTLNDNSICKLDKNNVFDFIGDNKLIELKSRHNIFSKYPTTMIGYNKIKEASKLNNKDVYFFFCFDDCLAYWKYDKNYKLEIKRGGRNDRGREEYNDYCFIPIELLIKVQ